jgi:hypothetical protein
MVWDHEAGGSKPPIQTIHLGAIVQRPGPQAFNLVTVGSIPPACTMYARVRTGVTTGP